MICTCVESVMLGPKDDKLSLQKNEPALPEAGECALLSEVNLAEDWNKPEEDEAWHNFQSKKYGQI